MSNENDLGNVIIKLFHRLEKIEHSPALNGGFAALESNVKALGEELKEVSLCMKSTSDDVKGLEDKLDKVYDPEKGLFPRIIKIESQLTHIEDKLDKEKEALDKQIDLNSITKQLKTIGGSDLEKINNAIKFHETFSKVWWFVLLAFMGQIVNILVSIFKK
jgi:predicted  nucleic acid-binding Zn-ribbon protein